MPLPPFPPRVSGLKRSSRATVTAWVLLVVPVLAAGARYMLWNLPQMLAATADGFTSGWGSAVTAFSHADTGSGLGSVAAMMMLAIPSPGMLYLLATAGWRAVAACRRVWRSW